MRSDNQLMCQWECLTEGCKCRECGYLLKRDYDKAPVRTCLSPWTPHEKLGDWTERQLKSIGITQDKYKEAKELFGLFPECGCDGRIEWLNKVSTWWRSL